MISICLQFDYLATHSDCSRPGVTRLVFSERDVEARAVLKDWMRQAGLTVREDVMGNTFGRWEGSDSGAGLPICCFHSLFSILSCTLDWPLILVMVCAGTVMTGSHSDTVVLGGPYDGALGVVGGIAAVNALRKLGFKPAKSIEAIMFTTEEASRFSIPCLGRYSVK